MNKDDIDYHTELEVDNNAVMNFRFRSIEQKNVGNRPNFSARDPIIMHADENFRFWSVEQKFVQPTLKIVQGN